MPPQLEERTAIGSLKNESKTDIDSLSNEIKSNFQWTIGIIITLWGCTMGMIGNIMTIVLSERAALLLTTYTVSIVL